MSSSLASGDSSCCWCLPVRCLQGACLSRPCTWMPLTCLTWAWGSLLALLALADSYSVPKVAAFAAEALTDAAAGGQLPWEGVLAVLGLPEACWRLPGSEAVRAAAVKQLQQELGDLEEVWNSTEKTERLLGLPVMALKQLLADDATAADSEDTVVYTIQRWLEQHSPCMDNVQQDMAALGQVVRLPHCSPSYIASAAAAESHWLPQHYTAADLAIACRLAADTLDKGMYNEGPELRLFSTQWGRRHAAWSLPKRPNSSSVSDGGHLKFDWHLPLLQVQDYVTRGRPKKDPQELVLDGPEVRMWQGRRWGLQATFHSKGIGLYVTVWQGMPCAVSLVSAGTGVVRHANPPAALYGGGYRAVVEGACGRVGQGDVIYFNSRQRGWADISEMLHDCGFSQQSRQGGLELHLQAEVKEVA